MAGVVHARGWHAWLGVACMAGGGVHGRRACGGVVCVPGPCVAGIHTPSPVNRITDRCKNITFPQLRLRAVIIPS